MRLKVLGKWFRLNSRLKKTQHDRCAYIIHCLKKQNEHWVCLKNHPVYRNILYIVSSTHRVISAACISPYRRCEDTAKYIINIKCYHRRAIPGQSVETTLTRISKRLNSRRDPKIFKTPSRRPYNKFSPVFYIIYIVSLLDSICV